MSSYKDNTSKHLRGHLVKTFTEAQDEKNKNAQFRLTLVIIAILAFVGSEAMRIIFRKNFGMSKESWIRLIICSLCFAGIAAISFSCINSTDDFAVNSGTPESHLVNAILFSILAITIVIKAVLDQNKGGNLYSDGDSNLLGFLSKSGKGGWSQKKVQLWAEPLLTLATGIALSLFNLLGGIAIIFCALSVWGYALYELIFPEVSLQATVDRLNSKANSKRAFYEINTD